MKSGAGGTFSNWYWCPEWRGYGAPVSAFINNNHVPGAAGGVEKEQFQQSESAHSGAGKKETLYINVVAKIKTYIYIYICELYKEIYIYIYELYELYELYENI